MFFIFEAEKKLIFKEINIDNKMLGNSVYCLEKEIFLSQKIDQGLKIIYKLISKYENIRNSRIKLALAIVQELERKIEKHKRKYKDVFYFRGDPDIHSMVDVRTSFIYKDEYENLDDAIKRIVKGEKDKRSLLAERIQRLLSLYCSLFPGD